MTLVKSDHPRWIDQFIYYFGESPRPASSGRPPCRDRVAPSGDEAA
jgi:hypothetical protein